MLIPKGQMVLVGTPFHKDDLYSLFEKSIDFAFRKYPAIDDKGNILWKTRHDKRDLDMRKRTGGNILFTREFLCKPISSDMSMFPDKLIKRSIMGMQGFSYVHSLQESSIRFVKVVTGCDFAISSSVGADYTCFVTFGVDEQSNMYLLHIYHKQGSTFAEQKNMLRKIWRDFKPDVMYLEANQFQRIYTETMRDESDMPVKPFITDKRKHSLTDGVPGLAILFENGKMHFPYQTPQDKEMTEKIHNEFRNIGWTERGIEGIGEHDDIVMAIWLARMATVFGTAGFSFDFM
jgi:phage terminase large subunit-like protein